MNMQQKPVEGAANQVAEENRSVARAWCDESMPPEYLLWRRAEEASLMKCLNESDTLIDYCCGDGRIIPSVLKKCGYYLGCDIDPESLELAIQHNNLSSEPRASVILEDWRSYARRERPRQPSVACCLGNTFSALEGDLTENLKDMANSVSREVFISVLEKGHLDIRKDYYASLGIPITIEVDTETIHSELWGATRAFSRLELQDVAQKSRLEVISIEKLGSIGLALRVISKTA